MRCKDTEIGRIPVEWEVFQIDEIGDVVGGGTPKTSIEEYWNGEISWITPKDLSGYTERHIYYGERSITEKGLENSSAKMIPKGTILFSSRAPIGYLAIAGKDMCTNQGFKSIVCNDKKVDNIFLYYLMMIKRYELGNIAGGSTFKEVSGKTVKEFKIPVPPLEEQKAIAHILSTLDEKIETNNQINKNLEEIAQTIFKHWFVDFEFPNEDGEPYKSSGGEMVESELGMIPKGWEVTSLDQIADYLNGLAMQKFRPEQGDKSYPVLKIKELRQGITDNNSDRCARIIENKYIINDGDVIFSWSGSLLVKIWCGGKCGLNQHLFKVTSDNYEKWFYYNWTKYHLDRFINIAESKATTMGHIKRKDLSDSKVLIPTQNIYDSATSILGPIYEKIIQTDIESRKLTQLRDTLLPKLMSGEIRVPFESEADSQ